MKSVIKTAVTALFVVAVVVVGVGIEEWLGVRFSQHLIICGKIFYFLFFTFFFLYFFFMMLWKQLTDLKINVYQGGLQISIVRKRLLMKCGPQKVLRRADCLNRGGVFRRRIRNSHFYFSSKETLILKTLFVFFIFQTKFPPF